MTIQHILELEQKILIYDIYEKTNLFIEKLNQQFKLDDILYSLLEIIIFKKLKKNRSFL